MVIRILYLSKLVFVSLTLALLLGGNGEIIVLYNGQLCYQRFGAEACYIIPLNPVSSVAFTNQFK